MNKDLPPNGDFHHMTRAELSRKMQELQSAERHEGELRDALHDLEVYQIELEMQNRELRDSRMALEESLERYVDLYDFAPVGYVTFDEFGLIRDINLTLTQILNTPRMNLLGRSLASWVLPADLRKFRAHVKRCQADDREISTEIRLLCSEKSIVFVELRTTRSELPDDQSRVFKTAVIDIGARKRAEEERDRFFELSDDLLAVAGTDGYFKRLNPAWEKALGFSREELLARPFIEFVHPDDRETVAVQLPKQTRVNRTSTFETRVAKKDREFIWLTWSSVLAGDTYYSVARDTTQQHLEAAEIENEQNWLHEMIESLPAAIMLVEAETGHLISMSSRMHEMCDGFSKTSPYFEEPGLVVEDMQGQRLLGDELPRMRAARGEELNGLQIVWKTPRSKSILRVFSRNLPAKYGRPPMALIVKQDITELKRVEESLTEAVVKLERERELRERFVSTLTHDLRTPLAAIKMSSELIQKRATSPEMVQRLNRRVLDGVDRLELMIYDLLDANRISAGEQLPLKIQECDLVEVVRKTLEGLVAIHGDRFQLCGADRCIAHVDPFALRRVIENLCNNAIKYGARDAPVRVAVEKPSHTVRLSVHNAGPGIPLADQEHLFDPYQRTFAARTSGKRGWGIGLTLVRGIAESHGGKVRLVSTDTEGTTFTIELPQA